MEEDHTIKRSVDCRNSLGTEVLPEEDHTTARSIDCGDSTESEVLPEEGHMIAMSVDCRNSLWTEVLPEEDHTIKRSVHCRNSLEYEVLPEEEVMRSIHCIDRTVPEVLSGEGVMRAIGVSISPKEFQESNRALVVKQFPFGDCCGRFTSFSTFNGPARLGWRRQGSVNFLPHSQKTQQKWFYLPVVLLSRRPLSKILQLQSRVQRGFHSSRSPSVHHQVLFECARSGLNPRFDDVFLLPLFNSV